MSINISTYFPVSSSIQTILPTSKVFAGLALSSNPLIPSTLPMLQFKSAPDVGVYFGLSSNEYRASLKYFAGSSLSTSKAPYIYFGKYNTVALAPYLRSPVITNRVTKQSSLVAVTAGDITVSVNGTTYATTGINLSTATSLSQVASLLTTAITTANAALAAASFTILYDGVFNQFVASITATGASAMMNYFSSSTTPNIATLIGFTQATGAILSQGSDAVSYNESGVNSNMSTLLPYFTDQYSIAFVDNLGGVLIDAIELGLSAWVSGQNTPDTRFNFFCWNNDSALELAAQSDTSSIWYQVNEAGYSDTSVFDEVLLNNPDRAFAAMGVFAALDLTQPESALTLAFKTQSGLQPSVTQTSIAKILNDKKINYYGNVGFNGASTQLNFFYGGYTTGAWSYIDNQVAQIWIAFQIQVGLANLFSALNQVPNDPDGDGYVRSVLTTALNQSIDNGIIATGVVFDNATVQQLSVDYGVRAQELTNNGYVIVKRPSSQEQRQDRVSSPWFVLYVKGSAVQYLPVNTTTYF